MTDQAVAVLTVSGDLDSAVTPRLADLMWQRLLATPSRLVVDLRKVSFLGVDALRLLVCAHRYATHRGTTLCLVDGTPAVNRALTAAGLHHTVPCFGSVEAARAMP
ncbi:MULTISPECIES: STAS domain-containing protein [Actinoalloteichus]|uniref:STAS domain-containing protein n=1 Tax=Actinoalloteichus TaxID=65496 RepID=UPI001FE1972A|nr:STAS domain-containing protein [Actinoalloteichus caeruleus]